MTNFASQFFVCDTPAAFSIFDVSHLQCFLSWARTDLDQVFVRVYPDGGLVNGILHYFNPWTSTPQLFV